MNNPFDPLQSNLLDLLYELKGSGIRITIGGGYGLYLKRQQIEASQVATLLSFIPPARVTNDLDVFLQTQLIADLESAKSVSIALQKLECTVVTGSEKFQFVRISEIGGQSHKIKSDLLTKMPIDQPDQQIEVKGIRVKNKKSGGVHAHLTEEAIAIEDTPTAVQLAGTRTSGEEYTAIVYIPQVYPYLMMKLFAFRDYETKKKEPEQAQKHALDLYSIIAMTTEEELATAEELSQRYGQTPTAQEAGQIVREFFSQNTDLGIIRLRENQVEVPDNEEAEFKSLLSNLFP